MELFNLADKCAKAKEGHLFANDNPDDAPEDTMAKDKEAKRKGTTVLAEPEQKRSRELPYNAIPGYRTLAKFMVVMQHGYTVLKMPG
ncbi:hypothetical protein ZWY2020_055794 [Hordeum vulgare]|nr:hypothetical protein ZWY2020_055794 [Hordeum vulgare]